MAAQLTALDYLRTRSFVACDTLDVDVAKKLGSFQDCTSNQAIAFFELSKPEHSNVRAESHSTAVTLLNARLASKDPRFVRLEPDELAVEIATVKLALKIAPYLRGKMHVQTNPYYAYSTDKTVANASRIIHLFKEFAPDLDSSRICIKIPGTWEGIMACRTLELTGIHTLATTIFSMPQAVLAAEAGCSYVAPYVNQLKVHFEPEFTDPNKLFQLCVDIQKRYEYMNFRTKVLPASLTSTGEVLMLAGADHITISPDLLEQLALPDCPILRSVFDQNIPEEYQVLLPSYVNDEAGYRFDVTRDLGGASEEKLTQAINIFCNMQDKLIKLVSPKSE